MSISLESDEIDLRPIRRFSNCEKCGETAALFEDYVTETVCRELKKAISRNIRKNKEKRVNRLGRCNRRCREFSSLPKIVNLTQPATMTNRDPPTGTLSAFR